MIFYFTATGNSKYIAENLSKLTGDTTKDIAEELKGNCDYHIKDDEKISIISPVYFYGLPKIVEEFISKIRIQGRKKIDVILNYGTFPGQAMERSEKILNRYSLEIGNKMTVRMPENYILLFNSPNDEDISEIIKNADRKIIDFAEKITENADLDASEPPNLAHKILGKLARPIYEYGRGTGRFHTNTNCIKCGRCVPMCPCDAIKMIDRTPTWVKNKCLRCCACINRCPEKAIEFGLLTKKKRRYVNTNVTFEQLK